MPLRPVAPYHSIRSLSRVRARRRSVAVISAVGLCLGACSVYDASLLDGADTAQLINEGGDGASGPSAGGSEADSAGGSGSTPNPGAGSAGEDDEPSDNGGSGGRAGSAGSGNASGTGGVGSGGTSAQGGGGVTASGGMGSMSGSGGAGNTAGGGGNSSGAVGGTSNAGGTGSAAGTGTSGGSGSGTSSGGRGGTGGTGNMTGGGGTGGSIPTVVELAANRSIAYSTQEAGNEARKGNDANLGSKWCAKDGTFPQWWRVDLGATRTLRDFTVTFEHPDRKYSYDIETSSNDTSYTRRARLSAVGKVQSGDFAAGTSARYVRITVTDGLPNTYNGVTYPTWACFFEFSVKGY